VNAAVARWRYAVGPLAVVAWQTARFWSVSPSGRVDFRIYHEAVRTAGGGSLYDFRDPVLGLGFTYPPFAAVLLRPFASLDVTIAEKLWLVVAMAMTVAFAALCTILLPGVSSMWHRSLAFTFFVAAMPVSLTLRLGQINSLIALLIVCDALLMARRSRWSGTAIGAAAAIKLTPGFIVLVLAAAGRVRAAVTAVIAAGVATLVGALVFFDDTREYLSEVAFETRRVGSPDASFNNSLRRPIAWLDLPGPWETSIWLAASVVVTGVVVWRVTPLVRSGDAFSAVAMASIGSALVSPITWGHHLLFLAPAVVIAASAGRVWWRWLVVVPGTLVVLDPFEGGEGPTFSALRLALMLALLAVPLDRSRQRASRTLRATSGTFVTSPSTPSEASSARRRGSSTVQTLTASPAA
jgi:alpha-1,2-mannosyltransferase